MAYSIRARATVIGWSDLEHADPSMGVAYGAFRPEPGYAAVQRVFRLFAGAEPETSDQPIDEVKLEQYYKERDALGLELIDVRGRRVGIEAIHIADYSGEAGTGAIELEVVLDDPVFWESHHLCP